MMKRRNTKKNTRNTNNNSQTAELFVLIPQIVAQFHKKSIEDMKNG